MAFNLRVAEVRGALLIWPIRPATPCMGEREKTRAAFGDTELICFIYWPACRGFGIRRVLAFGLNWELCAER